MKIVILGTRGFPNVQGGVEKHCENLAINLVRLECDVTVFTRSPYVDTSIKEFKGVHLVALPAVRNKSLEAFLHTFVGIFTAYKYRPDILHIHAIGSALFTPLARMMGMRVVLTTQGSNYKHLKWGRFAKLILRMGEFLGVTFSNKVIAVTGAIADEIKEKYKREAVVIPNGVDIHEISTGTKILEKFGLESGRYILTVGRIVPEKGFDYLIYAFSRAGLPRLKLVIAGQADHEGKYSLNLKEKAGNNKNVVLAGLLTGEPLRELYSHAGLFVLPSYYEGLPIVLLEAMSYGLSCIASDIPANRSVDLPERRFFKAGDVAALSDKIKEFAGKPLSEEERRNEISMIAEKYNWDDIALRTMNVYKKVMAEQ